MSYFLATLSIINACFVFYWANRFKKLQAKYNSLFEAFVERTLELQKFWLKETFGKAPEFCSYCKVFVNNDNGKCDRCGGNFTND